jgi:hypothetical protein
LFLLVLDGVLCRALDGKKRGITWMLKESLEDMEYAGSICLASHRYECIQRKLDDLWEESKKADHEISSSKTEEILVNTRVTQELRLNGKDVKRSSDFCCLGSVAAEDDRARTDDNVRIQKASGLFSKLRKVWLSKWIQNDTKIRIFNACVKFVLLYGCETWLVTSEIQHKIQTFVN